MLVAQLEKYGLLPDFQYGFRSFQSTADLMIVLYLIEMLGLL